MDWSFISKLMMVKRLK